MRVSGLISQKRKNVFTECRHEATRFTSTRASHVKNKTKLAVPKLRQQRRGSSYSESTTIDALFQRKGKGMCACILSNTKFARCAEESQRHCLDVRERTLPPALSPHMKRKSFLEDDTNVNCIYFETCVVPPVRVFLDFPAVRMGHSIDFLVATANDVGGVFVHANQYRFSFFLLASFFFSSFLLFFLEIRHGTFKVNCLLTDDIAANACATILTAGPAILCLRVLGVRIGSGIDD